MPRMVENYRRSWGEVCVVWHYWWLSLGVWIESTPLEHLFANIRIGPLETWLIWKRKERKNGTRG